MRRFKPTCNTIVHVSHVFIHVSARGTFAFTFTVLRVILLQSNTFVCTARAGGPGVAVKL